MSLSFADALPLFEGSRFKTAVLDSLGRNTPISLYRVGDFVDLCRGPHVPTTAVVGAVKLLSSSAVQYGADTAVKLQRVVGVAAPNEVCMSELQEQEEAARQRDHRVIGKQQSLFFQHAVSPGTAFFGPRGTRLLKRLQTIVEKEYDKRGYMQVVTPTVFDQSGDRRGGAALMRQACGRSLDTGHTTATICFCWRRLTHAAAVTARASRRWASNR